MRLTLAKLLAQAVKDIADFRSSSLDQQAFMLWVDKYQAQLVVLACQIRCCLPCIAAMYNLDLLKDLNCYIRIIFINNRDNNIVMYCISLHCFVLK